MAVFVSASLAFGANCASWSLEGSATFSPPPGVTSIDEKLQTKLQQAFRAKGVAYKPRTHHLQRDGTPQFINRLIFETSPYLLQHAHNPVNWRPWGDDAFEHARLTDKPVLLSVGYSTCHWCHVMERESFEDLEIASFINRHFVAIKVDREERPDVDDIYMSVVQGLTGRGGWPMTTVLTPQRQAFFGGTYFPPRDGARGAQKGFLTILKELQNKYANQRDDLLAKAKQITQRLQRDARPLPPAGMPDVRVLGRNAQRLSQRFEPKYGGFSRNPKFPRPANLEFLLRYYRRTKDARALHLVTHTLDHMYWGGMYDHVGGGFHRYATDLKWMVPHFEKMLYDNAQLAAIYTEAFQVTKQKRYQFVAQNILDYILSEMTSPDGAFYSATDADSPAPDGHDEEGLFFTWTPEEVAGVLGPERAKIFQTVYGITESGNFEGRSIAHLKGPLEAAARQFQIPLPAFADEVEAMKRSLYAKRAQRAPPIRDDKFLVSWNGLMLGALAKAGLVFNRQDYKEGAAKAAHFILEKMTLSDGRLLRTHFGGKNQHAAYLDDYAFLIHGLLDLFDATGNPQWLQAAVDKQTLLDRYYWDAAHGGYFMTAEDAEKLLIRDKPKYDGAEPCGNSVAVLNLLRLYQRTSQAAYKSKAEQVFGAFSRLLSGNGLGLPKMLAALEAYYDKGKEVVLVTAPGASSADLLQVFRLQYQPNAALIVTKTHEALALKNLVPWVEGKTTPPKTATAYVCEEGLCERPTDDPEIFEVQLRKVEPLLNDEPFPPLQTPSPKREPKAWEYNVATNQHWHPGHGHWHDGPPPTGVK